MRISLLSASFPFLLAALVAACGGGSSGGPTPGETFPDAAPSSSPDGAPSTTPPLGVVDGGSDAPVFDTPGMIVGTVRDFRFYDGTAQTNPDFENPPFDVDQSGHPSSGYQGPWDDHGLVQDVLGADGKPVFKPSGTTLTTHGKTSFDAWYHDVAGMNRAVQYPLPLTSTPAPNGGTQYGYDSQTAGVLYVPNDASSGRGFFPIDDGTPYGSPAQTTFGNEALTNPPSPTPYPDPQASNHDYSFTFELHTVFTYKGGEVFDFRGDDDVFVFIDKKLVIDLGGIHGPESATVKLDALGLSVGQKYTLDFFSAERHVTGSNIEFTTTLALQPPPR